MSTSNETPWSETDSAVFKNIGRIMIPRRDEIERVIVALIAAQEHDIFTAVDIAAGAGWLSDAILDRYPGVEMIVLDGSETMLAEAGRILARHEGRFELRHFRLEDEDWIADLPEVRCFASSLALHHLDDVGKRTLYERLYRRLEPGGALLIADLIQPASEQARQLAAEQWNEEVRRQSLDIAGNLDAYDFFVNDQWNIFEHPDPMDMPSTVVDHLNWLTTIGFEGVDVFWALAGHAVYGGYRPSG